MINENENEDLLKQKAKVFFDNQNVIHISYKNGYWKRGTILEISSDFFMLEERLEGKMPVFFVEIKDIQLYSAKVGA